ncbi:MAG: radical SAM protein [Planctomycetota bacterium]
MRIALVNPITRRAQGYHTIGSYIPQLGLQVLADLVPAEHQVGIIDEVFGWDASDELLSRNRYDLVGLTSYSSGATRAYEIAEICRRRGIPCLIGGPHASACPEEVAKHFDSVAVGECDEIWPHIIADAAAGSLKPRYDGTLSDLEKTGLGGARQSLTPINGRYDVAAIQTSRGCPVGCEYCSVTEFNGPVIRRRRIGDIVDEWNSTSRKFIFVVDDNFFGVGKQHAEWAKELLRALIRHGKKRLWFSQTTINMGEDAEGMRLAYQAGCRGMLVGFETFNPDSLRDYHKGVNRRNLGRYQELVNGFHRAGVAVFGGFIIGADEDTPQTVADTALTAVQMGIDIIQITNLTPLPGTRMYNRYREESRLLAEDYPEDWERYTFTETVYRPRRMSARELDEAIYELRYAAAREPWVWKRALRTLLRTRSISTAAFVYGMNKGWKRMAKIQAPHDAARFGFAPTPSARVDKIVDSFRMHLRDKVTSLKPPDDDDSRRHTSDEGQPLPVLKPASTGAGESA